jgi:transposase
LVLGVLALVGTLTGLLITNKRKTCLALNDVFHVHISTGGLSNLEKKISEALKVPYDELVTQSQREEIGHADETGWHCGNKEKGWLWVLWTSSVALFMLAKHRSSEGAERLLGSFYGILASDRYGAYNFYGGMREFCWAH